VGLHRKLLALAQAERLELAPQAGGLAETVLSGLLCLQRAVIQAPQTLGHFRVPAQPLIRHRLVVDHFGALAVILRQPAAMQLVMGLAAVRRLHLEIMAALAGLALSLSWSSSDADG